jgi:hypothetical protein
MLRGHRDLKVYQTALDFAFDCGYLSEETQSVNRGI